MLTVMSIIYFIFKIWFFMLYYSFIAWLCKLLHERLGVNKTITTIIEIILSIWALYTLWGLEVTEYIP